MKILYALLAAAILALGVLHMATTFRLSSSPAARVWFFGTGVAIALYGILNFLNQRYGLAAFGLRAVCIGTNLFMACLSIIGGRITGASVTGRVVVLTVRTSTLVLSALRSASIGPQPPRT